MVLKTQRDDFLAETKRTLAQRAGYICSSPTCRKTTIGPSEKSNDTVVNTGIAAHITAASPGGARYDNSLTSEERKSISNAIWLCAYCANLIDKDEQAYPTNVIKSWKVEHERYIEFKQRGLDSKRGFLSKVSVTNLAKITQRQALQLGKNNIFLGNNGVGKSLVCEFISSLNDRSYLKRWLTKSNPGSSLVELTYFSNEEMIYGISISNGSVTYTLNENPIPVIYSPYFVQYFSEKFRYNPENDADFISAYSDYFRINSNEFINLINHINSLSKFIVSDIEYDGELLVRISPNAHPISYGMLSVGEQERVTFELALRLANFYSKFKPTILIIEQTSFSSTDYTGVNWLINIVRQHNFPFQTIFTFGYVHTQYDFKGFKSFDFQLERDGIVILANEG